MTQLQPSNAAGKENVSMCHPILDVLTAADAQNIPGMERKRPLNRFGISGVSYKIIVN